ncbi:MAG: hypothetical protein ACOC83_03450 [Gemmatimonadota bacterium]
MSTSTIVLVLTLLLGFALSFWMPRHRSSPWAIGALSLAGCVFVALAVSGPEDRYADLFFALLAFAFAYRGWRERTEAAATT